MSWWTFRASLPARCGLSARRFASSPNTHIDCFSARASSIEGRRREPIFQILDEAARYIPQMIPAGARDLPECLAAWNQLVEEGRNIGIGVGLLTQRSARMNKSVSEVADAMISFRIVGPNSIAAVTDWLGEHVPKERIRVMVETDPLSAVRGQGP